LVIGNASIAGFNAKKLPVYDGYTEIDYDTQATFAEMPSMTKFVDDNHPEARYRCAGDCGEIIYEQIIFEAAK
jgi:hypothetical protein